MKKKMQTKLLDRFECVSSISLSMHEKILFEYVQYKKRLLRVCLLNTHKKFKHY